MYKFQLAAYTLMTLFILLPGCGQDEAEPGSSTPAADKAVSNSNERDYMVTASRPNNLNIIDLQKNEVIKICKLPGKSPAPGTIVVDSTGDVAYVLANGFSEVYGINIETCDLIFSTRQNVSDIRVRSMGSIAVSPDGKQVYTHQHRTHILLDRYEVLDTKIAVFNTGEGLDVEPTALYDSPRQVSIMATGADGSIYLVGGDIYRMDPDTGQYETVLQSRSLDKPLYSQRDALTIWPIGEVTNELIRLYSVAKFTDETKNMETATWLWGYESVNLLTGEVEDGDIGPLKQVLFTGVRRPGKPGMLYATLSNLNEYDIDAAEELRSIELDQSYYCINFSTDGSKIYLSGAMNDVAVYDADSLEKITSIKLEGDMALSNSYIFHRKPIQHLMN